MQSPLHSLDTFETHSKTLLYDSSEALQSFQYRKSSDELNNASLFFVMIINQECLQDSFHSNTKHLSQHAPLDKTLSSRSYAT